MIYYLTKNVSTDAINKGKLQGMCKGEVLSQLERKADTVEGRTVMGLRTIQTRSNTALESHAMHMSRQWFPKLIVTLMN